MNTTSDHPGRSSLTGPLWLSAIALSVIAVCLVWQRVGEFLRPEETHNAPRQVQVSRLVPPPVPEEPAITESPRPIRPVSIARPSPVQPVQRVAGNQPYPGEPPVPVPPPQPPPPPPDFRGFAPVTQVVVAGSDSGGVIAGRISLRGTPQPEKPLPLDPACGALYSRERLPTTRFYVVGTNGGLADVFVYIKDGLKGRRFSTPTEAVLLDQVGCVFEPYVLGLQTRQKLLVRNSDPFSYNVHADSPAHANREFNRAQPAGSRGLEFSFAEPEIFVRFKDDVHPWMFAYVGVVEHPYYVVSSADGAFALGDVPPGRYVLEAIHRKAGKQVREVFVRKGDQLTVDFIFDVAAGS